MAERPEKSGKEKPRFVGAEKETLSKTEDKLIVIIPPVRRMRIIAVEFELIAIPVQIKHIRVAVPVNFCAPRRLYHCPLKLRIRRRSRAVSYPASSMP
jgi:hypothetical protein